MARYTQDVYRRYLVEVLLYWPRVAALMPPFGDVENDLKQLQSELNAAQDRITHLESELDVARSDREKVIGRITNLAPRIGFMVQGMVEDATLLKAVPLLNAPASRHQRVMKEKRLKAARQSEAAPAPEA